MKAAIVPGCPTAPHVLVGGLPNRERLRRTLEKEGWQILSDPSGADRRIPDCRVMVGTQELHLCTDGIGKVENILLASLRKPADGLVSRLLNRRISLFLTRHLKNTRIRPNHISMVTLLLGVISGGFVALGDYWAVLFGALLLQLQSVLDGVDGELARLKLEGSRLGQWLDTLSDDLAEFSFLLGATIATTLPQLRWLGLSGVVALLMTQTILYTRLATVYQTGDLQVIPWDLERPRGLVARLRFLFRHDSFCLLMLLLALWDQLDVAVTLASVGRIVVFLITLRQLMLRKFRWRTAGDGS